MTPIVSIIMATRNNADYLAQAIDSILDQTFTDFEFIIIDDASTDDTPTILDRYDDTRIVRLCNDINLKLAGSLNRGLAVAKGDLIARMDSDDVSRPERLAKQVAFMSDHPEVGILGTSYQVIDENSQVLRAVDQPLSHGLIAWSYLSRHTYPLTHATILARHKILADAGGYNTDFPREQDGELFLRLIHSVKYANLNEYLYSVRSSRSSQSADEMFLTHFPLTVEIRRRCAAHILDREVTMGEMYRLIVPSKRHRRKALGITLTRADTENAIELLLEMYRAMSQKGYLNDEEKLKIQKDIPRLILHNVSLSEELFIGASSNFSTRLLLKVLSNRVRQHLSYSGNVFNYFWAKGGTKRRLIQRKQE